MTHFLRTAKIVVAGLLFAWAAYGVPAAAALTIGNYSLVSSQRVTRVEFEYTYRADVTNSGGAETNVTAQVTSTSPYTVIVEKGLSFGDVAAGATVTSTDTFTIRQDRRHSFNASALHWQVSSDTPPVNGVLLEGAPDALALSVLQTIDVITGIPASERDVDADDRAIARTELMLKLTPNATVADVNAILIRLDARIISMIQDVPFLLVRMPDPGTVDGLDALVAEFEAASCFEQVLRSYLPAPSVLPSPYEPLNLFNFDVIDHLLGINAPAAWNARAALQGRQVPTLLIADYFGSGQPQVPPFAIVANPGDYSLTTYNIGDGSGHGYHVLGIAAADFGGELTTGIFPSLTSSPLNVRAVDASTGLSFWALQAELIHRLVELTSDSDQRVIVNTSLGFECNSIRNVVACGWANAHLNAVVWLIMVRAANLEDKFLHVTAAGNIEVTGDEDASTASPFAAAALLPLVDAFGDVIPNLTNTIVVENVVGSAVPPYAPQCLNASSKVGGHVSAVGTEVWSYLRPVATQMASWNGTSMATPQVAALAANVWALEPTLSPEQLKNRIINTARAVTPPADLPAACIGYLGITEDPTPAPAINAYAAVLSVDKPTALTGTGTPADAPVRRAILDVADSNGTEGRDGTFDQGDVSLLKEKILTGFNVGQSSYLAYDWSRFDLSGEGHTGPDWASKLNLDINKPASWSYITGTEDPGMAFNEQCVSDLQALCYYAYSPLYQGDQVERDRQLLAYCGAGEKGWSGFYHTATEGSRIHDAMAAVDGRGNVYFAYLERTYYQDGCSYEDPWCYEHDLVLGQVRDGNFTTLERVFLGSTAERGHSRIHGLVVDEQGNLTLALSRDSMVVQLGDGGFDYRRGSYMAWLTRYVIGAGWGANKVIEDEDIEWYTGDASPLIHTNISVDALGNVIFVWQYGTSRKAIRYDNNAHVWEDPIVLRASLLYDFGAASLAMVPAGDAVVIWQEGSDVLGGGAIVERRYNMGTGWTSENTPIVTLDSGDSHNLAVVSDRVGRKLVVWSDDRGIMAMRFNWTDGWKQPVNIVGLNGYVHPVFQGERSLSMDECGNAMLVHTIYDYEDHNYSLYSKRFIVDSGWEPSVMAAENTIYAKELRLHGGGNATLIFNDAEYVNRSEALRYQVGGGWQTAVSYYDPDPDSYYQGAQSIIDRYGNAVNYYLDGLVHSTYDPVTNQLKTAGGYTQIQFVRFE